MTDFLLAVSFLLMLLIGYWMMTRLDRYLDSAKIADDDAEAHRAPQRARRQSA